MKQAIFGSHIKLVKGLIKMFQTTKSKTIILMTIIFLCSCTKSQDRPHPEGISAVNLNQDIQIIVPQAWNTFKLDDTVSLQIVNVSNKTLVFDKNFGSRIFLIENGQWIEVKDKLISIGEDSILMKPAVNNTNETRGFSVQPDVSGKTSKTEVRIYIFGKSSDTEEIVGAYTDVVLKP